MKRTSWMIGSILIMMAIVWSNLPPEEGLAFGGRRRSKTFSKEVKTKPGKTLYLKGQPFRRGRISLQESLNADITVMGANVSEIQAKVTLQVKDSDDELLKVFLDESDLILEPYQDGYRLYVEMPSD